MRDVDGNVVPDPERYGWDIKKGMRQSMDQEADDLTLAQRRIAVLEADLAEFKAAVLRMASYLGVAHTLKDPRV